MTDTSYQDYYNAIRGLNNNNSSSSPDYNPSQTAYSSSDPKQLISIVDKMGKISNAALNPAGSAMFKMGIPQHFNMPDVYRFSPAAEITSKLSGIDTSKTNDRDALGGFIDTMAGGYLTKEAENMAKALSIAKDKDIYNKLTQTLSTQLKRDLVKAGGSYKNIALNGSSQESLEKLRNMVATIKDSNISNDANTLLHSDYIKPLYAGANQENKSKMAFDAIKEKLNNFKTKSMLEYRQQGAGYLGSPESSEFNVGN